MLSCEGVIRLVAVVCSAMVNESIIPYDLCSFQKASTAEVQCLFSD